VEEKPRSRLEAGATKARELKSRGSSRLRTWGTTVLCPYKEDPKRAAYPFTPLRARRPKRRGIPRCARNDGFLVMGKPKSAAKNGCATKPKMPA
jgi:hypothetical protein